MSMNRKQSGFTLIELMIVIAIIGVLASVALPQYTKYIAKAKVSEVLAAASTCRASIAERDQTTVLASIGAGNFGCEEASGSGQYVTEIATSDEGYIRLEVNFGDIQSGLTNGEFVYMVFNANKTWTCGVSDTAIIEFMPGTCIQDYSADPAANWAN